MRSLTLLTTLATVFVGSSAAETIEAFGQKWSVPIASDWVMENGVLHLNVGRPQEHPRRPKQFALAETPDWQNVTISLEAKSPEGNLILVYAYRDESHFDYAHLSVDEATKQPVHNGIFHVYGGDRVRISTEKGPAALPAKDQWVNIQLTHDASTGIVGVKINGKSWRAFEAVDLSLGAGKIGIGSFFNTAYFRNVKITGTPAK
jgi:3-keto-disaccharide hydrolase